MASIAMTEVTEVGGPGGVMAPPDFVGIKKRTEIEIYNPLL